MDNPVLSRRHGIQFSIEVLDLAGRRVVRFENTSTLDLSKLAEGTYTLKVTLPDGVTRRRVVKK